MDAEGVIQKNDGMVPRFVILLTASLAIWLNGFAPLATGGADWHDGSESPTHGQVMPATTATAGAAIGVKSLDLAAGEEQIVEIVRQPSCVLPEPTAAPRAQRTLLAQHILLRI